jgi:hypothetical protein
MVCLPKNSSSIGERTALSLKNVLALATLVACGSSVHASSIDLNAADWSSSSTAGSPATISSVENGLKFSYNLTGDQVYETQTWTVSNTPTEDGTVTINWEYSGFYAYFEVSAFLNAFANGGDTITLINAGPVDCCSAPSAGFYYTGTTTLNVYAGQSWGFTFGGSNQDSNTILSGMLTLTDATRSDVTPEPGSGLLLATGLAAIAAFWRFGKQHTARS